MTLKYRAAQANCDNYTFGEFSAKAMMDTVKTEKLDFFVINCQEIHFKNTINQLKEKLPKGYAIAQSDEMPTHTKGKTQFHKNTGIITYVVYNTNTVNVQKIGPGKLMRRSNKRWGSAYNKGGLISDFIISNVKGSGNIKLETVSGHLESGKSRVRTKDWQNISKGLAKKVGDWDDLRAALPDLRISGFDANTRLQLVDDNSINPWWDPAKNPETQALHQAPLGTNMFSAEDTYETAHEKSFKAESGGGRKGYAGAGSLDFVAIANGKKSRERLTMVQGSIFTDDPRDGYQLPMEEESTKRDHDIIVSPQLEIDVNSTSKQQFDTCKGQIATMLSEIAPALAKQIWDMEFEGDLAAHKENLIKIYNLFLAPGGLLQQSLDQQIYRLKYFDKVKKNLSSAETKILSEALFPPEPWLGHLTLDVVKSEESIYKAQHNNIQQQYAAKLASFKNALDAMKDTSTENDIKTPLHKTAGYNLLNFIKKEFGEASHVTADVKQLLVIMVVLDTCTNIATSKPEDVDGLKKSCAQLTILSQKLPSKSASTARALGKLVLSFVYASLVIIGLLAIIPTGGTSLLAVAAGALGLSLTAGGVMTTAAFGAGVGTVLLGGASYAERKNAKKFAKSIAEYKGIVEDLRDNEEDKKSGPEMQGL